MRSKFYGSKRTRSKSSKFERKESRQYFDGTRVNSAIRKAKLMKLKQKRFKKPFENEE